ncbi:YbaK/EbsC family protein [Mesorhizobium sp. AR02]|uniref:aminoacyl-tRNA deacylase n=1 Tax=Mesorhizobium sp. AR02 TaxID=2865837 RepID=UPI00215F823B|nr:YbaK/EbsC family protein [Mesorhizobium sp. AR02]UVK56703.1 YbaK/EbsC family protein [Mesorhizobium sp. AR02]
MSPLVKRYLEERAAVFSVVTHRPLISFEDAKEILPHDPRNMVKSLVFRCADDSLAIVALRAAERADYKKIAGVIGERRADLRMAEEDCVRDRLDMEIGGVVPLPINGARVFIDRNVLELEEVVCGTGRNTATLVISLSELMRIAQAVVADLSKPAAVTTQPGLAAG